MNIAILTIASASLLCSAATLAIMAKTAKELKHAKTTIESRVEDVTVKMEHNKSVVANALKELDI